jgi:hypothetical protein
MNLEVLLQALMNEIYKINGKHNQSIEIKVEKPFVDVLAAMKSESIMRGCDKTHSGETIPWVVVGLEFGCVKFMNKEPMNVKAEDVFAEPPDVDEWKERIGGPGS